MTGQVRKMMEDLFVFLFFYLIQTLLMVYVGLALYNIHLSAKRLLFSGVVLAFGLWAVRAIYIELGIPFGTHTLVLTVLFIILLKYLSRQEWGISVGAILVSMTLVTIGGGASQLIVQGFGLTAEKIMTNVWLHIIMGHVENIFLLVMLIWNKVFGFTIINYLNID